MNKTFAEYLQLYFNDYLIIQRNFSSNTITSYKYTFKLLLKFITEIKNIKINQISFEVINKELIKEFLNYLENEKGVSITTRNQRLACIKSFYQYVGSENVNNLRNVQDILNIKLKKTINKNIDYFTLIELKEYFNSIDISKRKGRRDLVLITLMYDSACRICEIINIKVFDLRLDNSPCVTVIGKGSKERTIPIMEETKNLLNNYINENKLTNSSYLFSNSKKEKLTERTIQVIISKYNKTSKNISPHSLRRTKAIHLLEAGVDLVYIRDFLGHESVTTTEKYAKASVEYKNKMLSKLNSDVYVETNDTIWNKDPSILEDILNF